MGPEDKVGRRSGTKCSPVRQKMKRKTAYQIIAHVRVHTRVISNRPKIVTKLPCDIAVTFACWKCSHSSVWWPPLSQSLSQPRLTVVRAAAGSSPARGRACLQAPPSLSLRRLPASFLQHRCCASSWLAPPGVLMVSTPLPRSVGPARVASNVRGRSACSSQSMMLCSLSLAVVSGVWLVFPVLLVSLPS